MKKSGSKWAIKLITLIWSFKGWIDPDNSYLLFHIKKEKEKRKGNLIVLSLTWLQYKIKKTNKYNLLKLNVK